MNYDDLSKICNISGGLVCEKVGVVTINKEELNFKPGYGQNDTIVSRQAFAKK